jgi:UDP-N-acetylglucosamine--N-acetylmuramyl-(pentapeptide) pyrophosphoryl-undecaprenol N-acetylglucosamine transferase
LLVVGGSQGARFLNETAPAAGALLVRRGRGFAVTHVAGRGNADAVRRAWREAGVEARVLDFCDDMAAAYAESDVLLARSGAMTVSEAAAMGMPAVFVPLPHAADRHQHANARVLADRDAALMLEQERMDANSLADALEELLFDGERLARMHRASRGVLPEDGEARALRLLAVWLGRAVEGAA